jgi:hypothetical protein
VAWALDRLTFGGHIIETGTDSYRLAHPSNQELNRHGGTS